MQGTNKSSTNVPKSGDGTQQVKSGKDANWFGQSQEPQEEFMAGDGAETQNQNGPSIAKPASTKMSGSDEGVPTFAGSQSPGTPQRSDTGSRSR